MECPGWMGIKQDLDLTKIEDMVKIFRRRLLNERAKSENPRPHCTTPAFSGSEGAPKYTFCK